MNPEAFELNAAVGFAASASDAISTVEVGVDGAQIAGRDVRYTITDSQDFDAELVAEDAGIAEERLPALEGMQVSAANANRADSDEGLARAGLWRCW